MNHRLLANSTLHRALHVLVVGLLTAAAPGVAAVHVVHCVDGPFVDIDSAVAASAPRDTVLVEPCSTPYLPFEINGKTDLHLIGNGDAGVLPVGLPKRDFRPPVIIAEDPDQIAFTCAQISNSERVTLSGLTFEKCGFHAINIDTSEGVKILANRFEESFETVRDSTASGSQITGNLFVGGAFAVFIDGSDALISQNVILDNQGSGISLLSPGATGNQVLANVIVRSRGEAIFSAGGAARIERNVCLGNESPIGRIVLSDLSSETIVVGNITENNISDAGTDNIIVGNQ